MKIGMDGLIVTKPNFPLISSYHYCNFYRVFGGHNFYDGKG